MKGMNWKQLLVELLRLLLAVLAGGAGATMV